MSRQIVSPEALDFESHGRRDYFVKLEHTTLWAHHFFPVTVIVGPNAERGKGLLAIGSTHGDEIEGPVAIAHLLRELRTEDVLGRIILVPVLNVMAFKANRRETPDDGVNLNRAFPGDPQGSITYRLADLVTQSLLPQVHTVLDIHSGGDVARFLPTTSFHWVADSDQRREIEETARGFGARFTMVYQNQTPGLLTAMSEEMGKITVGTELGFGRAVQSDGVSVARQGVLATAIRQGLLKGEPPDDNRPREEQILVDTSASDSSFLAPRDGLFEPTVEVGAKVSAGDRVGWLHDFDRIDEAPFPITAPHDGYVITQAWNAWVIQGQVISQVGKPLEWTR